MRQKTIIFWVGALILGVIVWKWLTPKSPLTTPTTAPEIPPATPPGGARVSDP